MSTATVAGTTGEDRSDYTREESRSIRRRSLRLLGSLVAPLRWQLALAALVLVISTALRVAGPALIAYGINTALPQVVSDANWMPTIMIVAVYLVAGIGGAALIGWYAVVAARLTQAVMLDLRKRIFLHTQRLSLEFHESYTSGRIISRQTSDLDSIRELLDGGLNELVSGILYGAFTLAALLLIDWRSGLVLAVAGVPLYFLMRWFYRNSQRAYTEALVEDALREVMADTTTLVIAHRPSTVMLADRVALLEAGRVTAVGTHAELLRTSEHYRYVISSLEFEQARQQATEVNR